MKPHGGEKKVEEQDRPRVRRPYELYVVILRDNSNYFVGNVERHEKGTILVQNGYEIFISAEQILAEVAITEKDFKVLKHLNATSLLTALKPLAAEQSVDLSMLDALGKKKTVKRPTTSSQPRVSSTSTLGYLNSLINPISVKDWLFGQSNILNDKKLQLDQIADDGTQTIMRTGALGGGALGKYLKTKKRTAAAPDGPPPPPPSQPPDDSSSSDSEPDEDDEPADKRTATDEPDDPPPLSQERQLRKLDNPGGGRLWTVGKNPKGGGMVQTNEEKSKKESKARIERLLARRKAREAAALKKKNQLFGSTYKQFVSL